MTVTPSHFEEWKHLKEFPDYLVSDYGRIMRISKGGNNFCKIGRILSPRKEKNGYYRTNLYVGGKVKRVSIHRIIATAFLGKPPTKLHEVAHNDGVRNNNHVSNLRWATRKENHADKIKHGTSQCGSRNGNSKLKLHQVKDIKKSTDKLKVIAKRHKVTVKTVWDIRKNRSWKHLSDGTPTNQRLGEHHDPH